MRANERISEAVASLFRIAAASKAAAAYALGPIQMNRFTKIQARLNIGAISGGATVDGAWYASTTSGGSYTKIPSTDQTQVTATPTNIITSEITAETVLNAGLGNFVKYQITVATAAVVLGAELIGGPSHYDPASDYGLTPDQAQYF